MLQGHGDNAYLYEQAVVADFSSNIWQGKEPAGLKEHLFGRWDRINRYPEVSAERLGVRIAEHLGLDPGNVLVTAGTTESIYLIAQLFKNNTATTILTPSFSEYEDACRIHDHRLRFVSWGVLPPAVQEAGLVWVANPNNPTGAILPGIEGWIAAHANSFVVVDEAFIEFTAAAESLIPMLGALPNTIVLRSLTKAYVIPGLRLGYIVAGKALIARLRALKMPWTVNALAIEAGLFIFSAAAGTGLPVEELLAETAWLAGQLRGLGFSVYPSHTHFLLCEMPRGTAAELQSYLIEQHGILIRNADNFRGLGPGHFRIAGLSREKNQLLVVALHKFLGL